MPDPGPDPDADGLTGAADNCPDVPNENQRDADADGTGDACDDGDTDHDGVPDREDLCPAEDLRPVDTDGDGVGDQCDLCPDVADPAQRDMDGDGKGDACEDPGDTDEDGVRLPDDNCPEVPNPEQLDRDVDGRGDVCDQCPDAPDFSQLDGDRDGLGDACDVCPAVADDGFSHRDGDGDGAPPCAGDCDDTRRAVGPGAAELCNAADDDCDGRTDEDFDELGAACTEGEGLCERPGVFICGGGGGVLCNAPVGAPAPEVCNAQDDDCDGAVDEELGVVACGLGECAHPVVVCAAGRPGACDPFEGARGETCNGLDDDCDGGIDEDYDLSADTANCGRCGNVCPAGVACENGECAGRDVVRVCGSTTRDPAVFLRGPAADLRLSVNDCRVDGSTHTLVVPRAGRPAFAALPGVRAWVEAGGILVGEASTSPALVQAVLGLALAPGDQVGGCMDELAFERIFNRDDPLWRSVPPPGAFGPTGCGSNIAPGSVPGLVPLAGHTRSTIHLGYINVGRGRVWLVEADWGDVDTPALSETSLNTMAYILSGGADLGAPQCRNGVDDDVDGRVDLNDSGCEDLNDPTEFAPGVTPCSDGVDNDGNGDFDFPYDAGCLGAGDATEAPPLAPTTCNNGVDDDGDGYTDFPVDYGCDGKADMDEIAGMPAPACGDLVDNDADGQTDYTRDPQCATNMDADEFN
jgi:hypothetical protein